MDAASIAAHKSWMQEMSLYVSAQAPHHLVALGTEGFFTEDERNLHFFNPGAGKWVGGWVGARVIAQKRK